MQDLMEEMLAWLIKDDKELLSYGVTHCSKDLDYATCYFNIQVEIDFQHVAK